MSLKVNYWEMLFLFCLGLFLGTAFCMKWLEPDFKVNGEKFTIMGLEFFYPREKVITILGAADEKVKKILSYQLYFDFLFMAGAYPGIASLCMMARRKTLSRLIQKLLLTLALLQVLAWSCDIMENIYLLNWLKQPVITGPEFVFYHAIVLLKWLIALIGVLAGLVFTWKRAPVIAAKNNF